MNKARWLLLICIMALLSSVGVYRSCYKKSYFIPIPIAGRTITHIPYIPVEIEGKNYYFIIDLGFAGQAVIEPPCLMEIQNKVYKRTVHVFGILGKKYRNKVYEIPQLKINVKQFYSVALEENDPAFNVDASLGEQKIHRPEITAGALGNLLFKDTCVCLDLHFNMMAFCDSVNTFKKHLIPQAAPTKVPFSFKNGFIEFDITTPKGALRCILDSGGTLNYINTPNPDNLPIKDCMKSKEHFDKIQIGGKEFGPVTFVALPINIPVHIDAILGVDFLSDHMVLIDFINRELYVDTATQVTTKSQ